MAKTEAVMAFNDAISNAISGLYDAGFTDGVASVGGNPDDTPFNQADIDAAVAAASAALQAQIDALKLEQESKDALEESVADQMAALAQSIRDLTVKPQV